MYRYIYVSRTCSNRSTAMCPGCSVRMGSRNMGLRTRRTRTFLGIVGAVSVSLVSLLASLFVSLVVSLLALRLSLRAVEASLYLVRNAAGLICLPEGGRVSGVT